MGLAAAEAAHGRWPRQSTSPSLGCMMPGERSGRASTCRSRIRRRGRRPRSRPTARSTSSTACTTFGRCRRRACRRALGESSADEALRERHAPHERRHAARLRRRVAQRHAARPGASSGGIRRRRRAPRAALAERAARRAVRASDGVMPGNLRAAAAPAALARDRVEQAPRVGMSGRSRTSSTGPLSTMRPAYITQMRSARPATTREIVGDPDQRRAGLPRRASASRTGSGPGS